MLLVSLRGIIRDSRLAQGVHDETSLFLAAKVSFIEHWKKQ